MGRSIVICFIICLFAIEALATERGIDGVSATSPLFIWSNKKLFTQQNTQNLDTITEDDIETTLYSLLGLRQKGGLISDLQDTPDAVVLIVEPQLQSDQIPRFGDAYSVHLEGGAFPNLKNLISTSGSSLVAPYATAGYSLSLLDSLLERVAEKTRILLVRQDGAILFLHLSNSPNVETITLDELTADSKVFGNGAADLIVICLNRAATHDQLLAHDSIIGSVSQLVSAATSGNFVGMYTGNAAPSSNTLWRFPNPHVNAARSELAGEIWLVGATNTTNTTELHTYFTPAIIESFMILISLLTMLFVGMCNICRLQVPENYEAPKPQQKTL